MKIPVICAMTAAELRTRQPTWPVAWMSCLFSPYGTGLSNLPPVLPPDSFLILSDRTPVYRHDPERIAAVLSEVVRTHDFRGIVLDLQRPPEELSLKIVRTVVSECPCPVAVTPAYAETLSCPVLLPPAPLLTPLHDWLTSWKNREIWLETGIQQSSLALTSQGCRELGEPVGQDLPHFDPDLCCRYGFSLESDTAVFTLRRSPEEMVSLPENVTHLFGLYQELNNAKTALP